MILNLLDPEPLNGHTAGRCTSERDLSASGSCRFYLLPLPESVCFEKGPFIRTMPKILTFED